MQTFVPTCCPCMCQGQLLAETKVCGKRLALPSWLIQIKSIVGQVIILESMCSVRSLDLQVIVGPQRGWLTSPLTSCLGFFTCLLLRPLRSLRSDLLFLKSVVGSLEFPVGLIAKWRAWTALFRIFRYMHRGSPPRPFHCRNLTCCCKIDHTCVLLLWVSEVRYE
jgi:hypothetical protein